jgi:hypothetical protein
MLRNAARLFLERLNLLVNSAPTGTSEAMEPTNRTALACGPKRSNAMSTALQINVALWGMLICSGMQIAGWLQTAF